MSKDVPAANISVYLYHGKHTHTHVWEVVCMDIHKQWRRKCINEDIKCFSEAVTQTCGSGPPLFSSSALGSLSSLYVQEVKISNPPSWYSLIHTQLTSPSPLLTSPALSLLRALARLLSLARSSISARLSSASTTKKTPHTLQVKRTCLDYSRVKVNRQ